MKKLILCAALLAVAPVLSYAQKANAKPAATASSDDNMDVKRQFNSYIKMLEASSSRNTPAVAQDALQKAMAFMQENIAKQSRQAALPETDSKTAAKLKRRVEQGNKIYSDVKMMSVDAMGNVSKIVPLLNEYMNLL